MGMRSFLQGALDMLILKVVALQPIHGYAIVRIAGQSGHNLATLADV
jgi:DNA-binding PadR family transcriptional regulator